MKELTNCEVLLRRPSRNGGLGSCARPAVTDNRRAASGQLRTVLKGLLHAELPAGPLSSHPTCYPAFLSQKRLLRATRVNFRPARLHSPPVCAGVSFLKTQPATGVLLLLHTRALERVEDEDNDLCLTGEDLLQIELEST